MNLIYNISIKLFFVIVVTISVVMAQNDTTIVISGESDLLIGDSKSPDLDIILPDENDEFEEVCRVVWDAEDDSFDTTPISIYLSTVLGESFNPVASDIPNSPNIYL